MGTSDNGHGSHVLLNQLSGQGPEGRVSGRVPLLLAGTGRWHHMAGSAEGEGLSCAARKPPRRQQ